MCTFIFGIVLLYTISQHLCAILSAAFQLYDIWHSDICFGFLYIWDEPLYSLNKICILHFKILFYRANIPSIRFHIKWMLMYKGWICIYPNMIVSSAVLLDWYIQDIIILELSFVRIWICVKFIFVYPCIVIRLIT